MRPLSKDALLANLARRERVVDAPAFGGPLLIRELLRPEYLAAQAFGDAGERDAATGKMLVNQWNWHAAVVAYGLVNGESGEPYADGRRDPETGQVPIDPNTRTPMFTPQEIAAWPNRSAFEEGLAQLAQDILDLSEVASPKPSADSSAS